LPHAGHFTTLPISAAPACNFFPHLQATIILSPALAAAAFAAGLAAVLAGVDFGTAAAAGACFAALAPPGTDSVVPHEGQGICFPAKKSAA
jgi:hypothetical protein